MKDQAYIKCSRNEKDNGRWVEGDGIMVALQLWIQIET